MRNPLDWLTGYKTYFLGIASIAGGIVLLINGDLIGGFTAISTGLGLLTARRAVTRMEAAPFDQ